MDCLLVNTSPPAGSPGPCLHPTRTAFSDEDARILKAVSDLQCTRLERNVPLFPYQVQRILRTQSCPDFSIFLKQT